MDTETDTVRKASHNKSRRLSVAAGEYGGAFAALDRFRMQRMPFAGGPGILSL